MNKRALSLFLLFTALSSFGEALPKSITLATTDWCPYACEGNDKYPGIAHDYITQLLASEGIEVKVEFYPWSRSIQMANNGSVDGLLTAVYSEAPDLLFTTSPTDTYQMCFFTLKNHTWSYNESDSLSSIKLGVIANYGYGEPVDTHKTKHPNLIRTITSGGIHRLNTMLVSKRFDAFIDDTKVVRWTLKKDFKELRQAGCLLKNPFYLALNPNRPWAKTLIERLNQKLKATRDRLKAIQEAYY